MPAYVIRLRPFAKYGLTLPPVVWGPCEPNTDRVPSHICFTAGLASRTYDARVPLGIEVYRDYNTGTVYRDYNADPGFYGGGHSPGPI